MSKDTVPETTSRDSATAPKPVVMSPIVPKPRRRLRIKMASLIVLCLVILAGAGLVTYLVTRNGNSKSSSGKAATTTTSQEPKATPYDKAWAASVNGNDAEAQKILDQQLTQAATPQAKIEIYNQKMTAALNAKNYDEVIAFGQQADRVLPTTDTAQLVYQAYLARADITDAKTWLQQAINRLDKSSPLYERTSEELHNDLERLES